jgi:hypothetical protein
MLNSLSIIIKFIKHLLVFHQANIKQAKAVCIQILSSLSYIQIP